MNETRAPSRPTNRYLLCFCLSSWLRKTRKRRRGRVDVHSPYGIEQELQSYCSVTLSS